MEHKRYVVYENTLSEILKLAKNNVEESHRDVVLYGHNIDRPDLSEGQKQLQRNSSWQTRIQIDMVMYNSQIESEIEELVINTVLSKTKEDIYRTVFDKIMNSKMIASVEIIQKPNGHSRIDRWVEADMGKRDDNIEYIRDIPKLEKLLQDTKLDISFGSTEAGDFLYVESLQVIVYDYRAERLEQMIPKLIKRKIRNLLTYCLKNGKNIVPDEYLDKGKDGIQEWQEMKRSSNKNNSLEKRMIKDAIRKKKEYAADCAYTLMRKIAMQNSSWDIPCLDVDGRYNKTRTKKLTVQVLKNKSDQEIMCMNDEDILNEFKEYWKNILMDAYKAVEKCKTTEQ